MTAKHTRKCAVAAGMAAVETIGADASVVLFQEADHIFFTHGGAGNGSAFIPRFPDHPHQCFGITLPVHGCNGGYALAFIGRVGWKACGF